MKRIFEKLSKIIFKKQMNRSKPWKEMSREVIFEKFNRKVEEVTFLTPDNKKEKYWIRNEQKVATVLALTPEKKVILCQQFRHGPKKVLTEFPGGLVNEGEEPIVAAKRELLEETGYSGKMELVTPYFDDGYSTRVSYAFVATGCRKIGKQKLDTTEYIQVRLFSLDRLKRLLRSGNMTDIEVGYLGLDYLGL